MALVWNKTKIFRPACAGLILLLCIACFPLVSLADGIDTSSNEASQIVSKMTTKQKIEQMIMPAMRKWKCTGQAKETNLTEVNDEVREMIKSHNFAGVYLASENMSDIESTIQLTNDIKDAASSGNEIPYFISVEQEGGSQTVINSAIPFSGNMSITATGSTDNAYAVGRVLAQEVEAMGFNMNLALCLDVNDNPANPKINIRSFSDDANTVWQYGNEFYNGAKLQNICSAVKYFPGHGNTEVDSHESLPTVEKTRKEMDDVELLPFKNIIENNNVDCIVTAHVAYPQVDSTKHKSKSDKSQFTIPASLSEKIIKGILRKEYGYDGVVCTDNMEMSAITDNFDKLEAVKMAINAGNDIIMVPFDLRNKRNVEELDNFIEQLVKAADHNDGISIKDINKSCERIIQLKMDKGLMSDETNTASVNQAEKARAIFTNHENIQLDKDIQNNCVTLIKDDNQTLPVNNSNIRTVVMIPNKDYLTSVKDAIETLRNQHKISQDAKFDYIDYEGGRQAKADNITNTINKSDQVICFSRQTSGQDLKTSYTPKSRYTSSYTTNKNKKNEVLEDVLSEAGVIDQALAKTHEQGKEFILISTHNPYDATRFASADAIFATYFDGTNTIDRTSDNGIDTSVLYGLKHAINIMYGTEAPSGKTPVNLPAITQDYKFSDSIAIARGTGLTEINPISKTNSDTAPNTLISELNIVGIIAGIILALGSAIIIISFVRRKT